MSKLIFCDHCNKIIQYHSEGVEIQVNTLGDMDMEFYPCDIMYGIYHLHKDCLKELINIAEKGSVDNGFDD